MYVAPINDDNKWKDFLWNKFFSFKWRRDYVFFYENPDAEYKGMVIAIGFKHKCDYDRMTLWFGKHD